MRWMKHLTGAQDDEKMTALLDQGGIEGYGFYWLIAERVAAAIEDDHGPTVTYPLTQWSHRLHCHPNRVSKYLGVLRVLGLVEVESNEGGIRVSIPNLLKYRDEYTQRKSNKSGECPDDVTSKKERQNKKEKQIKGSDTPPAEEPTQNKPPRDRQTWERFKAGYGQIRPCSPQEWKDARKYWLTKNLDGRIDEIMALVAVEAKIKQENIRNREYEFIKSPISFLRRSMDRQTVLPMPSRAPQQQPQVDVESLKATMNNPSIPAADRELARQILEQAV